MAVDITSLLMQLAFSLLALLVCFIVGKMVCRWCNMQQEAAGQFGQIFYSLLMGMTSLIIVYAVITSQFKTVFTIALAALIALMFTRRKINHPKPKPASFSVSHLLWPASLVVLFAILLNVFPESQYKQYDSFFYLKISESLNLSGQENLSNYYNLLSSSYHGVEAYHYVELWLNAFLLRFTSFFIPNIQAFRIVTYTIIGVIFTIGLFHLSETINGKSPSTLQKILCISLLFLHLDVVAYLPENIRQYFVFSFEHNFLDRPNFRITYLFLIPVIDLMWRGIRDFRWIFFLLLLSMSNPLVMLIVVPSVVITWLIQHFRKRSDFISLSQLCLFLALVTACIVFYVLLRPENLPAVYQAVGHNVPGFYKSSWKFVVLTMFTSALYAGCIVLFFRWLLRNVFKVYLHTIAAHQAITTFLVMLGIIGIIIARLGTFAENAYQVAFGGFIAISMFVFIMFLTAGSASRFVAGFLIVFCCTSFFILRVSNDDYKNVLHNEVPAYNNIRYSSGYIDAVTTEIKKNDPHKGAFIADSAWYGRHYYSVRNPNVYHLPVTYILANKITSNVDFCLSPAEAILSHPDNKLDSNVYLLNALERSWFHKNYNSGSHAENVTRFVHDNRIDYLFLSPGVTLPQSLSAFAEITITDEQTGETFVVFRHQ